MDDYLKKQTLDRLSRAKNILIAVAKDTGLDGLAAGLALFLSLKKVGKSASIFAKEPNVGEARQLYAIDKIGGTSDKKDLLITVNNAVKNVDRVTYFLEGDQLKIVVHSLPSSQGIQHADILLGNTASKPEFILSIGFESSNQLKQEVTHEQNIDSSIWIVNLCLGNIAQKFAQVHLQDSSSTSLSELVTKLMQDFALPLDEDISFNLYCGIKFATDSFSPKLTTQSTLALAQYLLKSGAGKAGLAANQPAENTSKDALRIDFKTNLPTDVVNSLPQNPTINQNQKPPVTNLPDSPLYDELVETPIERVEAKESTKESWLKPPKIYRGSKSFDRES